MKTEAGVRAALVAAATVLALSACDQKPSVNAGETAAAVDRKGAAADAGKAAATPGPAPAAAAAAPKAGEPSATGENAALATKVKPALAAEPELKVLAIDVNASGGTVMLFGTADTRANRERAGKVASGVEGVKSVQNNLVLVKGS